MYIGETGGKFRVRLSEYRHEVEAETNHHFTRTEERYNALHTVLNKLRTIASLVITLLIGMAPGSWNMRLIEIQDG